MTKREMQEIRREAKEGIRKYGLKIPMTAMILLEMADHIEHFMGTELRITDYIMFEDKRTGKQYQMWWGDKYYNPELNTLWTVTECTE